MKKQFMFILVMLLGSGILLNAQLKSSQPCVYDGYIKRVDMTSEIETDEKKRVYVEAINEGTCIWNKNEVWLVVELVKGPSGSKLQRDELVPTSKIYPSSSAVGKGETAKFYYDIEGPSYTGEYKIEFNTVFKGSEFGDGTVKYIKVVED